ncbi:MAG TPA: hypothetical protein PLZ36_06120, partial [Armatimonadota bacterium]|nr:hypothetical protein [Armatimonadota bacterium]
MRSLNDALHAGAARAGAELGVSAEHLPPEVFGVALSYALAERLREGEFSRAQAETALRSLRAAAENADHPLAASWLYEPPTASRVIDLARDACAGEPLAPPLLLLPAPQPLTGPAHALVFSAFPHITHELYPLLLDAGVAAPALRVVGVHLDWFRAGRMTRAITFAVDRDLLYEAPLAAPLAPASAQALGLDLRREHADHRRAAALLPGVPLLNPPDGAAFLDDKARTAACWQRAGLATPAWAMPA